MIQIDIEMPKGCRYCPCIGEEFELCNAYNYLNKCDWLKDLNVSEYINQRPDWCPLKEIKNES